MTIIYKKTFSNLTKDLTEIKKAELKEIIFEVTNKWFLEMKENKSNFKKAFLSNKQDKYFNQIKEAIGKFKGISKMSVLDFLSRIILGYGFKENKIFEELHEEFLITRKEFNLNYEVSK